MAEILAHARAYYMNNGPPQFAEWLECCVLSSGHCKDLTLQMYAADRLQACDPLHLMQNLGGECVYLGVVLRMSRLPSQC